MFNLRNASKIVMHFHTICKLSELREREQNESLHAIDGMLSEGDEQIIYGEAEAIAMELLSYSNEILNFYTDAGNDYVDRFEHDKLGDKTDLYESKAIERDFIVNWCLPAKELTDDEYTWFIENVIGKTICYSSYLVLRSLKYDEFLKTKYWMAISRMVKDAAGECEECGATDNLHVHHLTYDNHGNEHNNLGDLKCLCRDCHLKAHHELNKKK